MPDMLKALIQDPENMLIIQGIVDHFPFLAVLDQS
jgi:hypothetical protein